MRGFDLRYESGIDGLVRFVGKGVVRGMVYDLGRYPALLPGEGRVVGEPYQMVDPPSLLRLVDAMEGCRADDLRRSEYVRTAATVSYRADRSVRAWTYYDNRHVGEAAWIPSGDYVAYVRCRVRSHLAPSSHDG